MKKFELVVAVVVSMVLVGCASHPRSVGPQDERQVSRPCYGGMAAGAAIGGLAGHQVGKGRGKTLATIAGAAVGAAAGQAACDR